MINLRWRLGTNKVPVLCHNEIENHVDALIADYNPDLLEHPKALNVDDIAENYFGLRMHYTYLSHNGFIWGRMVFHNAIILVFNANTGKVDEEPIEKSTIIIDNNLLTQKREHAYRSTVMHECAHWIYHRSYYSMDKREYINLRPPYTSCGMNSIVGATAPGSLHSDHDWIEHQAKYFSAAILMPRKAVYNIYNNPFIKQYIKEYGPNQGYKELTKLLSKTFHVSLESASIRLQNLGLSGKTNNRQDGIFPRFDYYEFEPNY